MNILRINHTRPSDNSTDRIQVHEGMTRDFQIMKAGLESGIEFEAKYLDYTWQVALSSEETKKLIDSILKK